MTHLKNHIQIGQNTYHICQIAFRCLLLLYAILILFTFRDYGITSDETHHVKYGEQIIKWYTSGFEDQSVFQTQNTWLYGGFFDITAYLISQILPLDRYGANHLTNAFFGLLGIVAAYRIGALLGGPTAGLLAAIALFLTPRYYGHAFNNPKDIPFAVCYLWAVSYLIQYCKTFPHLTYRCLIGTGLSIGFALGIRIGGLLLIAYLGLLTTIQLYHHRQTLTATIIATLPKLCIILFIAYATMLICWPYALQNPISGPITALQKFSQFTEAHTSFFDGRYVINTDIPRTYAPTWFLITLPEFALIGILISCYVLIAKKQLNHFMLFLVGIFPILYAIVMNTPLYDGIRHLLFAMPPLVIFGTIGIYHIIQYPKTQRIGSILFALLFLSTAIQMIRLHPNQYIYFNTLIAGGVQKASAHYETDYWENTLKQGIRWIEQNTPPNEKITVSSFTENMHYQIDTTRFEITPYFEKSDIYLGTTRYDRHRMVSGEVLHTITSLNTPLLYIIRPDTSYRHDSFFYDSPFYQFRLGEVFEFENKPTQALSAFQKALELTLQTSPVEPFFLLRIYIRIGNQYEALNQFDNALITYQKALEYAPQNAALHNNIGITCARLNKNKEAIQWLQKATKINPDYFSAWVNLGGVAAQHQQEELALKAYKTAIDIKNNTELQYLVGKLEYNLQDFDAAIATFQNIIDQHPNNTQALHDLALALAEKKNFQEAKKIILRAIQQAPNEANNYFTLGSISMYLSQYHDAVQAYQKSLAINPQNADAHIGMGLALAYLGDIANAQKSLQNALIINPNHPEAKHHLQTLSR